MRKVLALTALLVALTATSAAAAPPVVNGHDHFVSDPYAANLCGIEGTSVDTVVVHFIERPNGAVLESVNITTLFTATESGKSIEVRQTGVRSVSASIDNGDGTYSIVVMNSGQSPRFKIPQGPPIVLDVGLVEFLITFDSATGDFVAFDLLKEVGQRPPGCATLVPYLTDP